ncbi:MAG: hypothetical protein ACTSQG_01380 [Promethearchaeota archaeon]
MTSRLEPELVRLIEEIVSRRVKEELEARSKLVTIEIFTEAMERIDKRFEALQKQMDERFEAMAKRFEALQKQMNKRFEVHDKKFNKMFIILQEIQQQIGKPFEQFARNVVIRILEGEGHKSVNLKSISFTDENRTVFKESTEIEIDGYSEEPPVLVEITSILRDQDKVDKFLRKKEFIERLKGQKFRGFFIAAGSKLLPEDLAKLIVKLRKYNCELLNL